MSETPQPEVSIKIETLRDREDEQWRMRAREYDIRVAECDASRAYYCEWIKHCRIQSAAAVLIAVGVTVIAVLKAIR